MRLPARAEQLWLVVVAGFGEQSILLLTNLKLERGIQIAFGGRRESIEPKRKLRKLFDSSSRVITWKISAC